MHKFTVGQMVELVANDAQQRCAANYVVIRLVANSDGDPQYRIKSPDETMERIVGESRLTLARNPVGPGGAQPDMSGPQSA
jgi:hypothetical protein